MVPPGAYVRSADYYWSFNEFVDSGTNQIFQNTGEYSFGLFNASASLIQQNNDSIYNGSTWYTLKFDKIRKQCITVPGFENVNHSCLVNPNHCEDGISMEVWLKFQRSDFESTEAQAIISAGNSQDGGHGGYFVYAVGRQICVLVADGSVFWLIERNLPSSVQPGQWFNIAFRWRSDKGVQLFLNSELLEEIPFSRAKQTPLLPSDNKMYVGCRKHDLQLKDFADYEMDELAFWRRYLPDDNIIDFTGRILPLEDIESTIFKYVVEIEELVPSIPTTVDRNPFFQYADYFEPCDNSKTAFDVETIVNTTRGVGKGVMLSQLATADVMLSGSDRGLTEMTSGQGVSISFWILPDMPDTATANVIVRGQNWFIGISEGNLTITATYVAAYNDSEPTRVRRAVAVPPSSNEEVVKEVLSFDLDLTRWSNIAFSFKDSVGLELYHNGEAITDKANVVRSRGVPEVTYADGIYVFQSVENMTVSDFIGWKRYLYSFEAYRFLGMSPSESYLDTNADLYWSTDYWVSSDKAAIGSRLPIYQTKESQIATISNAGMQGHANKGQAMMISDETSWVMLGKDKSGEITENTGEEFAGTCLSDPSRCENGLTLALWLNLVEVTDSSKTATIITSGQEDSLSRGFSITILNKNIDITLVDGIRYWRVSLADGSYPVGKWMHLAFSWKVDEGLWVFLNGELVAANKEPLLQSRPYDRYNRITLGRNNANNAFGGFIEFAFQEIAVYYRFTVTYRIRELFALIDNSHYEKANRYYNKETIITGTIDGLKSSHDLIQLGGQFPLGPHGDVLAFNNTISLTEGAYIVLDYILPAPVPTVTDQCIVDPVECVLGLTVSTWARTNLLLEEGDDLVYLLSSHQEPEKVVAGSMNGWTIYFKEETFRVALVSHNHIWDTTISELAKPLLAQRWTNIAFTWSVTTGMSIILDGQVAGILKAGEVTQADPAHMYSFLMVGHSGNNNKTFIDIFNVAVWEQYYYGSRGYELTGHTEEVITKYSAANLMWSFDGPIHLVNAKFDEMLLRKEIYDKSLVGAALEVTRDGLHNASLGNYSSECITQPSSCKAGFQLGVQLKLAPYTPGEGSDKEGSILLLGSPDVRFEGIALQLVDVDGDNRLRILVVNNKFRWNKTVEFTSDVWFDLLVGWNLQDGIAVKIDNKKVKATHQKKESLTIGSSKLVTNKLILGVGSGGGTSQGVDAEYNDITVTYNSNLAVEQENRCYDSATLYYRLNKGQIFTMWEVIYVKDRGNYAESGFYLKDVGYVDLDQFVDHCFSDPSHCSAGMSLSVYVKVESIANSTVHYTLLSSGYPETKGYRISVSEVSGSPEVTLQLNNGFKTWSASAPITMKEWTNISFTWNATSTGLSLYVAGQPAVTDTAGRNEVKDKTDRMVLTIGRGNADTDTDYCDAIFDDVAIWDYDITSDYPDDMALVAKKLAGLECNTDDGLLVEAEVPDLPEPTTAFPFDATERPAHCTLYDKETQLCSSGVDDFIEAAENATSEIKVSAIPEVLVGIENGAAVYTQNATDVITESEKPDKLFEFVLIVKYLNDLEIEEEIDPRVAESSMSSILGLASHIIHPPTWKDAWGELDYNSTNGPAAVIADIDDLALKFTKNIITGFDKEDDCSSFKSSAEDIVMSCEKRRLYLCDRDYSFPRYDKLMEDAELNETMEDMNHPTDTVTIPLSAWPKGEYADDAEISVAVIIYGEANNILPTRMDLGTFVDLEATTSADNPEDFIDTELVLQSTLNSRVMSIVVDPPILPPLAECVVITLEHIEQNTGNERTAYCAFWDEKATDTPGGAWSSDGCEVTDTSETHTVCCCYHLTSFAIMMEPLVVVPEDPTLKIKEYLLYACIGLSVFSLLVFCLVIICNKSLRSERNMVHLNLSISMILASASYLSVHFAKDIEVYCQAAAIAQHYFFLVAYAWIVCEALCLFYAVLYGQLLGNLKCYVPMAWLIPAGIVALCLGLYLDKYGLNDRCWLTYNDYIIMAMLGPILLAIFIDLMLLLIVVCNLPQPTLKREDILSEVRWAVFYAMLLIPVLTFTWFMPLLEVLKVELTPNFDFVFIAAFSLQGFFCFLVYGLGQRSVRMGFMRKKYQPAYSSSALIGGGSSRASSNLSGSGLVEVKPQPLSRPTSSRSTKEKSSPRPTDSKEAGRDTPVRRRGSVASAQDSGDEGGYIP